MVDRANLNHWVRSSVVLYYPHPHVRSIESYATQYDALSHPKFSSSFTLESFTPISKTSKGGSLTDAS